MNDEMVQGYMDGRDKGSPEPSENRSHSYRHGFKVGRNEIQVPYKPLSSNEEVLRWAELADSLDNARHMG